MTRNMAAFWNRFIPKFWRETSGRSDPDSLFNYRRVWWIVVLIVLSVSVVPLVILTVMNLNQYRQVMEAELIFPVTRLVSNTKRTLAYFLDERKAALNYVVQENDFRTLTDQEHLSRTLSNLKQAFGGFVDLGIIGSDGRQLTYVGPYELGGVDYSGQEWFKEVMAQGVHISPVFRGFRDVPHIVIAVRNTGPDGDFFILRATIDTQRFTDMVRSLDIRPYSDAFIIDRQGILQTPSLFHGGVLEKARLVVPPYSDKTEVHEMRDENGDPWIMGYAYIPDSPFVFVLVKQPKAMLENWWKLRNRLLGFLAVSVTLILLVILAVATYLVSHVYDADTRRSVALHEIEYSSKMASLGRLAAGVAHEINNPLAIINEKAGLLKDLLTYSGKYSADEKLLGLVDSILGSVERCSAITRRMLGFARHVDVEVETLELRKVIEDVLGFLEKEAEYRNIAINVHVDNGVPTIQSDKGQLQQIFLNIFNNAFAAMSDGGSLDIGVKKSDREEVSIDITDTGCGIPAENLKRVFEPFFSTKGRKGTGLGLSITYGLVQKLGGRLSVQSEVDKGTTFTVTLPVNAKELQGADTACG